MWPNMLIFFCKLYCGCVTYLPLLPDLSQEPMCVTVLWGVGAGGGEGKKSCTSSWIRTQPAES